MFERLNEKLAEMREQAAVDASQFNDSVAEQTDWTPLKSGGANFHTHKLVQVRPLPAKTDRERQIEPWPNGSPRSAGSA